MCDRSIKTKKKALILTACFKGTKEIIKCLSLNQNMKISIVFLLFCMAPSAYGQTYFIQTMLLIQ